MATNSDIGITFIDVCIVYLLEKYSFSIRKVKSVKVKYYLVSMGEDYLNILYSEIDVIQ